MFVLTERTRGVHVESFMGGRGEQQSHLIFHHPFPEKAKVGIFYSARLRIASLLNIHELLDSDMICLFETVPFGLLGNSS